MKFSIRHRGCWSSDCYDRFPDVRATLLSGMFDAESSKGEVKWSFLWHFEAKNEKELDEFLEFFRNHKTIEDMEVVYRERNYAIVHERSAMESAIITDSIRKNRCYIIGTMSVDHGFERWTVLAEKPEDLTNLIHDLNKLGELIVEKIGKYEPERGLFNLTEKQLRALKLALSNGYYEWPRRITLDELAAIAGVTRRTFQDHLRKAEAKVFKKLMEGYGLSSF